MKRINLIPSELHSQERFVRTRNIKIVSVLLLIFLFQTIWQAFAIFSYKITIVKNKEAIITLQSRYAEIITLNEKLVTQREIINSQRSQISQKLDLLRESRKKRIIWSNVLKQLSELVPNNIKLTAIFLDRDRIIINGLSSNNMFISDFMEKLDESGYFKKTGFNYIEKDIENDNTLVNFEIVTNLVLNKFDLRN